MAARDPIDVMEHHGYCVIERDMERVVYVSVRALRHALERGGDYIKIVMTDANEALIDERTKVLQ